MLRPQTLYLLAAFTCASYVALVGMLHPVNNWDLIAYIASVFSNQGLTGAALHDATFAELRQGIPPDRFDLLTSNGAYAQGVFNDPLALEQQLPFYRIRALYVLAVHGAGMISPGLTQAVYLISAASAAGLTVMTGISLRRSMPHLPWPVTAATLATMLYISSVPLLARLATPDAMFSLGAFAVLALLYRARTISLCILAVLPLIRTDAIVLSALVFALLLIERDRTIRHYGALAMSAGFYLWVNAAYGNYGHLTLFNFTLIPGQRTPYPAELEIVTDPAVYLDVYLHRAAGMLTRPVPWILLVAGACVAFERSKSGRIGPEARLAGIAIAYVVLHFLAFPLGVVRHYSFALLFCSMYIAQNLALTVYKTKP